MKTAAIIPARFASTRFPGKPLHLLAGKPLVQHVWERCLEADTFDQIVIATDDMRIAEVAFEFGAEVALTSPKHQSGTDRIAEVAKKMPKIGAFFNVQGDEPLIDPALIRAVASHLAAHPDCAIATAAHPIEEPAEVFSPNVVKVVLDARGRALYFSRAPIPWMRDAYQPHCSTAALDVAAMPSPPPDTVFRHIGLYAYRARFLRTYPTLAQAPIEQTEMLEQLRAMWHGERIAVLVTPDAPAPGVDTPADLERVRLLFSLER